MEKKLSRLNLHKKTDVNILLLGESGVGKTTFINSLANYLHCEDLETAVKENLFFSVSQISEGKNLDQIQYDPEKNQKIDGNTRGDSQYAISSALQNASIQQTNIPNEYYTPHLHGALTITVAQAKLTRNHGMVSTDPYCVLRFNGHEFKTGVSGHGWENPSWFEDFECVLPPGMRDFSIEVFDRRTFRNDKLIARATISIPRHVLLGETQDNWHPLTGKGKEKEGSINIILRCTTRISPTQDVKSYVIPMGNGRTRLRFIDTPGIKKIDEKDEMDIINCGNILTHLSQLECLHAVCFLFKPNYTRNTSALEFYVKHILSKFEKLVTKNIVFIFTNTNRIFKKAEEASLKICIEEIRKKHGVDIKAEKNIFSFDNEAFLYLAALKQGFEFEKGARNGYIESWKYGSEEAWSLISYIIGDTAPYFIKTSTSIIEARRMIYHLRQPLADISVLILDNIRVLEHRERRMEQLKWNVKILRTLLYVPSIHMEFIKLTQPVTICCSPKCAAKSKQVDGITTWNHILRCHDPCYLRNFSQELLGAKQLKDCAVFSKSGTTCIKCSCALQMHMHTYYLINKTDNRTVDISSQMKSITAENAQNEAERVVLEIQERKTELEKENDVIINCAAKFAGFLQRNENIPSKDSFRQYMEHLINREKYLGKGIDEEFINHLQRILNKYDHAKSQYDQLVKLSMQVAEYSSETDAKSVSDQLEKLYALKHYGIKLKSLSQLQKTSSKNEYDKAEYVHWTPILNKKENIDVCSPKSDAEKFTKKFIERTLSTEQPKDQCCSKGLASIKSQVQDDFSQRNDFSKESSTVAQYYGEVYKISINRMQEERADDSASRYEKNANFEQTDKNRLLGDEDQGRLPSSERVARYSRFPKTASVWSPENICDNENPLEHNRTRKHKIRVKAEHHKYLIGKSGARIRKISGQTGARIVFPKGVDDDPELIIILGRKESVEAARNALEAAIEEIEDTVQTTLTVNPKHHKYLLARSGEKLKHIYDDCGVQISFPKSGDTTDQVKLRGPKNSMDNAIAKINEIISDLELTRTIECIIPHKHHRSVMGPKGQKVKRITSDFDVQIKFPDRDKTEEYESEKVNGYSNDEPSRHSDVVKITGEEENCLKAKQALLELVPVTISLDVPFEFHRSIIGQKGRDVKQLMGRFDVHVALSPLDQKEDVIKITGAPSNARRAKTALLEKVKELKVESFVLKLEINPKYHPRIIGKRGAIITKIRKDHDVQIQIPKKGDTDEHMITIKGYQQNAEAARDAIMKIVSEVIDAFRTEVKIDASVHSRLIGAKGRSIRKIMQDYRVTIQFPRSNDSNPNLVVITGDEDNVIEARDHLLKLEEEYKNNIINQNQ